MIRLSFKFGGDFSQKTKYQPIADTLRLIGKFRFLSEPVISKNITILPKLVIRRCNHPILRARNIGGYLAIICNSMIIEMCDDIIRVSHGFEDCQMLEYIAGTFNSASEAGIDDITRFF